MNLEWLGVEGSLLDPWFLLLLPLAPAAFLWSARRTRAALPAASVAWFDGLPKTLRARLTWLPAALLALAALALVVALARPVTRSVVPLESEGVDILLVLDTSSSMMAMDVDPGTETRRMDAAREQALAFAKSRTDDRVGLVTFARYADLRCPPTLDSESLAAFTRSVDTVQPGSEEDSTSIGVALALATSLLKDVEAESRIVVLLSDGEDNSALHLGDLAVDPQAAAKLAADAGVRVYTIGLGRGMRHPFGGIVEADFSTLERMAAKTGGAFYRAKSSDDLAAVYAEIDRLETRELEDPRYRTADWFAIPLLVGAALLALGLLIEFLWIREVP